MSTLRLKYEPEKDFDGLVRPDGELRAYVDVPGFSAHGFAWFTRYQIQEFAQLLAAHPLARAAEIRGGYENGSLTKVLLGISVQPVGHSDIVVRVDPMSDDLGDKLDIQQSASLGFWTDYASLDRFRSDVIRMLDDENVEAILAAN